MQKKIAVIIALALAFASPVVRAEDSSSLLLTDDQIGLIRTNCLGVQSTLQRIHANDALARFNLGQQYNIISTKLMAPMNSRVALSKIDGVALLQATVDFNAQYDQFDSMYQQYETTLQRSLKLNCKDQPVAFFDTVSMAREHRAAVRSSINKLNQLLIEYRAHVVAIQSSVISPGVTKESAQ
jgi:hypothetical protein